MIEEEESQEPETKAPSISVAATTLPEGVEGTQAAEAEQVEELLVNVVDKKPEDVTFIPLWWGKESPRQYFKKSDPEWQGFINFSNDKKKQESVKCM